MSEFFEPLYYGFMRDAILVGSIIAAMCAVLSCFLVLKGWSLMGDAVSHAVLPGIVLAYIIGLPLAVGAFIAGLCCAVTTGFIKQNSRIKEDTAMGVVFTGFFAFGLVLFSKTVSDIHLDHILVGNILGIEKAQILQTIIMGAVILVLALVFRRDLMLICFDVVQARVSASTTFCSRCCRWRSSCPCKLLGSSSSWRCWSLREVSPNCGPTGSTACLSSRQHHRSARQSSGFSSVITFRAPPQRALCWCRRRSSLSR